MLDIILLAAGKGSRMKSELPKVLHPIGGTPLLAHVLRSTKALTQNAKHYYLVVGHGNEQVEKAFSDVPDSKFVQQQEQLGTGHAVQQALPFLKENSIALVLYGDVPLIKPGTLARLIDRVDDNTLSLLTVNLGDPTGYGRIIRDASDGVTAIVEHKDASAEERNIQEVNTGIMALHSSYLQQWLPLLSNDNVQGEFYLTDIIAMAVAEGVYIATEQPKDSWEVLGINDRQQQAEVERIYQQTIAAELMAAGVSLLDPKRFDCRGTLECGSDTVIDINCVFEGHVSLGNHVHIEPNCFIKDAKIGDNTHIKANSMIEETVIGEGCDIGPFARLRPGTQLANKAKIGNFVETKKAVIGEGSKVNHLSYVGDAELGKAVNVGAGTITCNYDGTNKHKTTLGDRVFVGSNSALVAPLTIEDDVTIGAGSTISKDVEKASLALTRSPQKNIKGWKRP